MLSGGVGAEPGLQGEAAGRLVLGAFAGGGDQGCFGVRCPSLAPGGAAPSTQAVGEAAFAQQRIQRQQPVRVGWWQRRDFGNPGACLG